MKKTNRRKTYHAQPIEQPVAAMSSMQYVERDVCRFDGHNIGVLSQNVVQLPNAMHLQGSVATNNSSICMRCGMYLAEIRGGKI